MTLADQFPYIPTITQGECCGCVIPVDADGHTVELRRNECGAVVGAVDRGVLEDLVWLVNATK